MSGVPAAQAPLTVRPVGEQAPGASAAPLPLLELQDLHFRYPRRPSQAPQGKVLQGIDLALEAHEITVLLGPSGCGKSTLLGLAAGLIPRQQGRVLVAGKRSDAPHPAVGVVFQQPALLPWLSVHRNVEFGLTLRHSERLSPGERRQRVQEALRLVGLEGHGLSHPSQLSGGMAQRAALARVLVRRPRLLLLDEPFSALDAVTRSGMQQLLQTIVARTGCGVLIVTHDVEEAIALGHRIVLMERHPGRLRREWRGVRDPVISEPLAADSLAADSTATDSAAADSTASNHELRAQILQELGAVLEG